jgi:hypothetical protein
MLNYNNIMLVGNISQLYITQGINIMKAIIKGNNIIQQYDINWSKRILGKEALIHIKTKTIIQVFSPKIIPYNIPSINGLDKKLLVLLIVLR